MLSQNVNVESAESNFPHHLNLLKKELMTQQYLVDPRQCAAFYFVEIFNHFFSKNVYFLNVSTRNAK